jgi:murein DD-endopeptidase MepM/ murein hydrolase activator NlpD
MRASRVVAALFLVGLGGSIIWWADKQRSEAQYVVVKGDTLWEIAESHGISLDELRAWNTLNSDHIEVGQVLRIGGRAQPSEKKTASRARKRSTSSKPTESGKWKSLSMPSVEPCLSLDTDPEEGDMIGSAGLSMEQVRGSLRSIVGEALRCEADEDATTASITFSILVGCDGVVDAVDISDRGDSSSRYTRCVGDVLRYADFPAHDMPDGMRFTYPVNVEF